MDFTTSYANTTNFNTSDPALFEDNIKKIFDTKLSGEGYPLDNQWGDFLRNLNYELSWGYSNIDPYINGNYAVFMQHGTWFNWLKNNYHRIQSHKYISSLDDLKLTHNNILRPDHQLFGINSKAPFLNNIQLGKLISDINPPEMNKEYIPISTRQRNSFVNTRSYTGSDFNMNWIENNDLDILKYHETWHKVIDLIRDGKLYIRQDELSPYMVNNPYCNTVWIAIFEPHTVNIKALIAIFGVMPVNFPTKTIIGDRSGSKIANYSMNYKFMDMQIAFYDNWEKIDESKAYASSDNESNLASLFKNFLNISDKIKNL